ncbi:hypothetical protein H6G45_01410 [Synechocystis sp. FACHB-383]|nr:hypothetical protein [Synechocystis sp. FACHB-383]
MPGEPCGNSCNNREFKMSFNSFNADQEGKLKHFLQAHRPGIPAPSLELENQILQRIKQCPRRSFVPGFSWQWLGGGVLLVGLVGAGLFGWRSPMQTAREPDMAELEAFLQESWSGAIYPDSVNGLGAMDNPNQEWWLLTDSPGE